MSARPADPLALITGGVGFIGTNVADRLLRDGWRVRVFDNFSRAGVTKNLDWLRQSHGGRHSRLEVVAGDVRDRHAVRQAVTGADRVFHLAAQVAVTTSLVDPLLDHDVNTAGTLHLLEAVRALDTPPTLLYTSTNKVYGHLDDLPLRVAGQRYEPDDAVLAATGIGEAQPLIFGSPYGCSKGAADQYVLDYARTFLLPAAVFRMSCIYGPHQFGTEDQGWVAHFLIRALQGAPLTIYGDGRQVRDILFVDDLVDAMLRAHEAMPTLSGQAFNIGGGGGNTISLLELIDHLERLLGARPRFTMQDWRAADQRFYVSNTRKFQAATGWRSTVDVTTGLGRLASWLVGQREASSRRLATGVAS
jgi:CDP-paratose 2-epimerase